MGISTPASAVDDRDAFSKLREWSRDEVASRILAGETLFIYRSRVVRVAPSWLARHPGGELAIHHFVGRDATDEIDAFHDADALALLLRFVVARVRNDEPNGWEPFVPPYMAGWIFRQGSDGKPAAWVREAAPVQTSPAGARAVANGYALDELSPSSQILLVRKDKLGEPNDAASDTNATAPTLATISPPPSDLSRRLQAEHSTAYKELHRRIVDAGLYKTPFITGYGPEVVRYVILAVLAAWLYSKTWYILSAVFLGLCWHQLAFFAHDLGHMGVTHDWTWDRIIAIFVSDFCGGLSIGWWVKNHNVHHLVTNHPNHDPDIEHLPFFAISPHFLSELYSSYYKRIMPFDWAARLFLRAQHKLFYVVMAFARFNLYRLSYGHLIGSIGDRPKARGGRWAWWAEIIGIVSFWYWYSHVLRGTGSWQNGLAYLLVSHVVTSPLHVQIVLSHFSRSTADLGPTESFMHRQLRTTADVICPESLSFLHGGLHLQVTHHLFPRLPRHNLRAASHIVKQFAREQGIEYAEFGFLAGNKEVRGTLRAVAQQVRTLGAVADANIQEAISKSNLSQ